MKKRYLLLVFFSLFFFTSYAQSPLCATADPFCAGGGLTFPNVVDAPSAEPGIDYDCLGSQPNPASFCLGQAEG